MACTQKVVEMQAYRLNPKAVAKELITGFADLPPLTPRERERVFYALRFIHPDILERIEAEAARKVLQKMAEL